MRGSLRNPTVLYLKAALLLTTGLLAATILLIDHPHWRTLALLAITTWAFCRAYYFAFYVVEHYIDPKFRFAGLCAFAMNVVMKKKV